MLGTHRHIMFESPLIGTRTRIDTPNVVSMNDILREVHSKTGSTHDKDKFHFSLNARAIQDFNSVLSFNSGDLVVATFSKVGGSLL